jgi:hypothetical protein
VNGFIDHHATTNNHSATADLHKSPQHPLSLFQPAVSSRAVPWQRLLTVEILQLPAFRSFRRRLSFRTACRLFLQLNWIAVSSQPPLQSSTALSTQLSLNRPQLAWGSRYVASGRTQQKTPFPKNPSVVFCVFVAAGTCLPSRCPTRNVSSSSTIPAFRRHVTIFFLYLAYFSYFVTIRVRLRDHLPLYVCMYVCMCNPPLTIFERLNLSVRNLVRISCHLKPYQWRTS